MAKINDFFEEKDLGNSGDVVLDKIKVTVIIPFYNRYDRLFDAIDSVVNQTHKNIELLLINDGSTESLTKVKNYIKSEKRIKLINLSKNSGPARARNTGIDNATGEYVVFLDSDDIFLPEKIQKQLLEMCLTGYQVSHTSYIRKTKSKKEKINVGELHGKVIPKIIQSCTIATPTVMIQRALLEKNKFKFREDIRIGEDVCFWLEILRQTPLLGIEEYLTIVNVSPQSASMDTMKQLKGLGNILAYVFLDKEYFTYHKEIAHLCQVYTFLTQSVFGQLGNATISELIDRQKKDNAAIIELIDRQKKDNAAIIELIERDKRKDQVINDLINSGSWKITSPLRKLRKIFYVIQKRI